MEVSQLLDLKALSLVPRTYPEYRPPGASLYVWYNSGFRSW